MDQQINSEPQALSIMLDVSRGISDREAAARYLEKYASKNAIDGLIRALSDNDFGVRWAASTALARLGEQALPSVLKSIIHGYNARLREGVYHVLHYNKSVWVWQNAEPLMQALKSSIPDVLGPQAAAELLENFKQRQRNA
jgi:HEAT repeat protein